MTGVQTCALPISGVYAEGAFDLAGTVVGLVDRNALLPAKERMQAGDLLIGLPSSGPHTNGYSLIRKVITGHDLQALLEDGKTLIDALLAPHRCYVSEINRIQAAGLSLLGMAHITGGGFIENIPRVLPEQLAAQIDRHSWQVPPLFQRLVEWGGVDHHETFRVFNMGIGMVLVVGKGEGQRVLDLLPEASVIGKLVGKCADDDPILLL